MWNCNITAAQPSAIPQHNSNAINAASGLVQLYNCTLTAIGDESALPPMAYSSGIWDKWNCVTARSARRRRNGAVYDFEILDSGQIRVTGGHGSGSEGTYVSSTGTETYQNQPPSSIAARGLFYNDSTFDQHNPLAGVGDDAAMASDKSALRPGLATATFNNVSSYTKGINGLTVDLSGSHGDISADDFTFKIGNDNAPANWIAAPAPVSVELFGGAGVFGSDRIRIIWEDGSITNTWLEVTLLSNSDTGLANDDVFYFGNAVGDSGAGDATRFFVNATDEQSVRNDPHGLGNRAAISNTQDYNRDSFVNSADQQISRNNVTNLATARKSRR